MNRKFWSLVSFAVLAVLAPVAQAQQMAEDRAPVRPAGMAESFVAPPRGADGGYVTPNRALTMDEATWHLRVALNVAALGCRDAEEIATVARYNARLTEKKDALAAAGERMAATYRQRHGDAWQARHDDAMTRLYNFWAQPPAHEGFCRVAHAVLAEVATIEPGALADFAPQALARMELPFITAFADADLYHAQVASWTARHAPPVMLAVAAAVPVQMASLIGH